MITLTFFQLLFIIRNYGDQSFQMHENLSIKLLSYHTTECIHIDLSIEFLTLCLEVYYDTHGLYDLLISVVHVHFAFNANSNFPFISEPFFSPFYLSFQDHFDRIWYYSVWYCAQCTQWWSSFRFKFVEQIISCSENGWYREYERKTYTNSNSTHTHTCMINIILYIGYAMYVWLVFSFYMTFKPTLKYMTIFFHQFRANKKNEQKWRNYFATQ